jgi:hypothetical protein
VRLELSQYGLNCSVIKKVQNRLDICVTATIPFKRPISPSMHRDDQANELTELTERTNAPDFPSKPARRKLFDVPASHQDFSGIYVIQPLDQPKKCRFATVRLPTNTNYFSSLDDACQHTRTCTHTCKQTHSHPQTQTRAHTHGHACTHANACTDMEWHEVSNSLGCG